jgi:hypothetical protein
VFIFTWYSISTPPRISPVCKKRREIVRVFFFFFWEMRLLHTTTLRPRWFAGEKKPQYAILSHTWYNQDQEVTFADIATCQNIRDIPQHVKLKKGFQKLLNITRTAAAEGYEYVWIDSCCINKESSTELQEAINSMWKWYQWSSRCYIFLEDFEWVCKETPSDLGEEFDLICGDEAARVCILVHF